MKSSIFDKLVLIYDKYVSKGRPERGSQMCMMWPSNDPPDVVSTTTQIEDIEDAFDIEINEDEAVLLFDMTLSEASAFVEKLVVSQHQQ